MSENDTPIIEQAIINGLLTSDVYVRQVIPFLKKEYFEGVYRELFVCICKFVNRYNALPSHETLKIELFSSMSEDKYHELLELLSVCKFDKIHETWLYEETEKWCQERALFIAIMESISIIDGKHKTLSKDALPQLLSDALGVSFDRSVGHDYIGDADKRYEFYHLKEDRIPFDIELLNTITNGGITRKSLMMLLAASGVGKSLVMCHMAAANLSMGHNVLYITMEMSEERICERIDANLMDIQIDQLKSIPQNTYQSKIAGIKKRTTGRLIVKEYPTGAAHAGHFRALIKELKLKKNFIPDVVYIDYLNICASSRIKSLGGSVNTYSLIKSVCEEVRGLAIEFNIAIISATQGNRDSFNNSDLDATNTSESIGTVQTVDLMLGIVSNEDLDKLGQYMFKQVKNRYSDLNNYRRFFVGVDKSKMKLYDISQSGQTATAGVDDSAVKDHVDDATIDSITGGAHGQWKNTQTLNGRHNFTGIVV